MKLTQNLAFSLKLFYRFYIRRSEKDKFLRSFVFKTKYVIDSLTFVRIEDCGKPRVICRASIIPELDGYIIDSYKTMNRIISEFNLPLIMCNGCGKLIRKNEATTLMSRKGIDVSVWIGCRNCVARIWKNKIIKNKKGKILKWVRSKK